MKKVLYILLAVMLTSCTATLDKGQYAYNLQYFQYSEDSSVFGGDGEEITFKNTLCDIGDSDYGWVVEEMPYGKNRVWRILEYSTVQDILDDFSKLATVSEYDPGFVTIIKFSFKWEGAEEMNQVTSKKVGGSTILQIHTEAGNISVPEKFVKNAKKYIEEYEKAIGNQ